MPADVNGDKLVTYLEAWAETMTTAKARWAVQWAARAVRNAMADPSHLDLLPGSRSVVADRNIATPVDHAQRAHNWPSHTETHDS